MNCNFSPAQLRRVEKRCVASLEHWSEHSDSIFHYIDDNLPEKALLILTNSPDNIILSYQYLAPLQGC